ncbi:MAG: PEP-CTERM sorting domain-containing protein [Puniceicoccaceae bacterium]|nr:MAG: PEP-CTERM sorting domain-containing protein [Puniceicoccaceae bacterium]
MKTLRISAILAGSLLAASGISAQLIDNTASLDPTAVFNFQPGQHFGQIFQAPAGSDLILDRFGLYLGLSFNDQPVVPGSIEVSLHQWNAGAVGAGLFSQSLSFGLGLPGEPGPQLQWFDFFPNLAVDSGQSYLVSVNAPAQNPAGLNTIYLLDTDPDLSLAIHLGGGVWHSYDFFEAAFQAELSSATGHPIGAVPEPSTYALAGILLLAIAILSRRR